MSSRPPPLEPAVPSSGSGRSHANMEWVRDETARWNVVQAKKLLKSDKRICGKRTFTFQVSTHTHTHTSACSILLTPYSLLQSSYQPSGSLPTLIMVSVKVRRVILMRRIYVLRWLTGKSCLVRRRSVRSQKKLCHTVIRWRRLF